jgi:hypothetical protein
MALSDIKMNTTFARQLATELNEYSNTDLELLFYDISYDDLRNDLIDSLGLDISLDNCTTNLDLIYSKYTVELKKALTFRQLYYYYFDINSGLDSKTYNKMVTFEQRYNDMKSNFSDMRVSSYEVSQIIPTGRM